MPMHLYMMSGYAQHMNFHSSDEVYTYIKNSVNWHSLMKIQEIPCVPKTKSNRKIQDIFKQKRTRANSDQV